jgi:inner membrane protein
MTAPNHIAGGVFFTAFFASLWNYNIFSNINMLIFTIVASILPDIDHTKSFIGKAFYPLAKYIDRRFGHRTITHSLIFLITIWIINWITIKYFHINPAYNVILFFSVLSHFILDMITLQGIPLFYPFIKNPCVIPGNPALRMEGGKPATEAIAFIIFTLSILTCWDLFSNGFWTSYNKLFGTVSHVYYEFKSSNQFVEVQYDYTENAQHRTGSALLLHASEDRLILYENKTVTELSSKNNSQKINKVAAIRTQHPYIEEKQIFIDIQIDSLTAILSQKFIIQGEIQSNHQFATIQDNITTNTKTVHYEYQYSPLITGIKPTADTTTADKQKTLKIKTLQLKEEQITYQQQLNEYNTLINKEKQIADTLKTQTGYQRNKLETELITLKKQTALKTKPVPPQHLAKQEEIRLLEEEIKQQRQQKTPQTQTFTGYIQYPKIPEQPNF